MIILPSQAFIDFWDEDRPAQGLLKVKTLAAKSDNQIFVGTYMVEENCSYMPSSDFYMHVYIIIIIVIIINNNRVNRK